MNEKVLKTLEYDKILLRLEALAVSDGAKALCRSLKPMTEKEDILTALKETSDAEARFIAHGNPGFTGIHDIRAGIKRAQSGSSLSMPELLRIEKLLAMASKAKTYGREDSRPEPDSLSERFGLLSPLTPLRQLLEADILSEEEMADQASPGLAKVRRQLRTISDRIHTELNALLLKHRTLLQDAVVTMRDGRYCLPVKAENKSQVSGIVHDQSGSGKAVFIEPMSVVKLNNEWRELEIQEQKEIELVLADLTEQTVAHAEEILTDYHVLTELDFIFAKARLSRDYKGTEPVYEGEGKVINIKKGRHPLLDPAKVVPIDIRLGGDYDLLIITGPNTGGKTVSLKTVGLLTLMGQSGLHIPAAVNSRLCLFKEIYADIGDEQSIEQSLSTFSSHMTNIVKIMAEADEDSLVLFDELGAGTDPVEGAALAMAILSRLHSRGIYTCATTHYSELKVYALSTPGVENASCEFDVATLRPTYRLLIGIPGKSNAFAISRKLGLAEDIIAEAGGYIDTNQEAFEDVIADLDKKRGEMEQAERAVKRLHEEATALKAEAQKLQNNLDQQKARLLQEAREEARSILAQAKEAADQAIRDMHRRGEPVSREMEEARAGLRLALEAAAGPEETREPRRVTVTEKKLRLGDLVHVHSLGAKGTVASLPDAKGRLTVQMGILRTEVQASDLELVPEDTTLVEGKKQRSSFSAYQKGLTVSTEINLIGMTVDDALQALDKYLDDAWLAHISRVRIIHGRGTGALKKAVAGLLRRNKHVAGFTPAPFNEGGDGATVAELKVK
ncbi:MAG: endonuclease MutS2 [Lachnospiraceae bacterium]|nr:endonuclease MutS2 [Lachnospiraceae bacterium]